MAAQSRTFLDARERLLRLPEVRARVGLGVTTVYRYVNEGRFPRQVKLLGGRVAWRESEINQWIQERIDAAEAEAEATS